MTFGRYSARALPLLALTLMLSSCGWFDRLGLFSSDKPQQQRSAARDATPVGTLTGAVEADPPLSSANVRVEVYDVTGIDPDQAVAKADPVRVVRSDRNGRFTIQLGGMARTAAGQAKTWLVRAAPEGADPKKSPEARVTFSSEAARGKLPLLYLWDGNARADVNDATVAFRFNELPGAKRMDPAVYGVELASSAGGGSFLPFVNGKPEIAFARLALQEFAWTYRPQASLEQQSDGTVFHAVYRGVARSIQGGNPPPLTRLREAKLVPPGLGFRSLTDGKPDQALPHQMPPGAMIEIDLGSTTEIGSVFLFGLAMDGEEEVTVHLGDAAGRLGQKVAQASAGDAFEMKLPPGARGRYLSVRFAGRLVALAEIVAYPPLGAQKWEAAKPTSPFSSRVDKAPVN